MKPPAELKKILFTSFSRYSSTVASFIVIVLVARNLGPSLKGVYSTVQAYGGAAGLLATLSISGTIFRGAGIDSRKIESLAGSYLLIFGAVSLLVAGGVSAAYALLPEAFAGINLWLLLPLVLIALFYIAEDYTNYLITYLNRIEVYNTAILLFAVVLLAVSSAGFLLGWGIWAPIAGFLSGKAAHISWNIAEICRRCGRPQFSPRDTARLVRDGLKLHINIVGTVLMNHFNVLLLNLYTASAEIGFYQLAFQMVNLFLVITRSANMMFLSGAKSERPDAFWKKQSRYIGVILALITGGAVFAWFAAVPAIPLVFGEEFLPSVHVFQILLFALPGMVMSDLMTSQWLSRGYFLRYSLIRLLVGGISCGLNFLLIPAYGLDGLLTGNLVVYAMLFAVNFGFLLRLNRTVL